MALTASSLKWFYSGGQGSAHNNNNSEPTLSLGGGISTVEVRPNDLFRNVRNGEVNNTYVYRAIYLKNTSTGSASTDSAINIRIWVSGLSANTTIKLASNQSGAVAIPTGPTLAYCTDTNYYPSAGVGYSGIPDFAVYDSYATNGYSGSWADVNAVLRPGWALGFYIQRFCSTGFSGTGTFTLNCRFNAAP